MDAITVWVDRWGGNRKGDMEMFAKTRAHFRKGQWKLAERDSTFARGGFFLHCDKARIDTPHGKGARITPNVCFLLQYVQTFSMCALL
jgi:hypothetical protein